jgi:hypothetical protein
MDLYVFATPYRVAWDYYMRSNENHTFEIKAWEDAAEMEYVRTSLSKGRLSLYAQTQPA